MGLVFSIHSDTLCCLIGAFRPFTFTVIIDRYDFSAIILSIKPFLEIFSVLFQSFLLLFFLSPLIFLVGLVYWSQTPLVFVCLGNILSLFLYLMTALRDKSILYLMQIFPIQHIEYFMPLPSGLPGFYGEIC